MSSTRGIEKVCVWMRRAADERRDDLRARWTERHAVTGEATAHEQTRAGVSDIRERVVREAHRACPSMRDRRVDAVLVQEGFEVRLHAGRRALFLADLLIDGHVAPPAHEHASVRALPPVLVAALRIR